MLTSNDHAGAKGQFYRPLGGQGVHFIQPQSVTLQFRTVYIRTNSREQPLRLRLKALGFRGLAAVVIIGASDTPKLYKQKPKDKSFFLLHLRAGTQHVLILMSMGYRQEWCHVATFSDNLSDAEKVGNSKELLAAIINGRIQVDQRMHKSVALPEGELGCKLKARPQGWLELPHISDLQKGTTGLERVYSLELERITTTNIPIQILSAAWCDKS